MLIAPDKVPEPPTAASPTPEPIEEVTSPEDSLVSSPEDLPVMQTPIEQVQDGKTPLEKTTPKQETPAMVTPREPTPKEPTPVDPAPEELIPTQDDLPPDAELKPEDISVSVMVCFHL